MNPREKIDGYTRMVPAACLRVTGADALSFLQGQVTQELRVDRAGSACYGLLLSQKGKVVADCFILRVSEQELWLVSYRSPGALIRERLEAYIIADDVTISDESADRKLLSLIGDAAADWLEAMVGALPAAGAMKAVDGGGFVFRGRRGVSESWEWLAPRSALPVPPGPGLTEEELERMRVAAGVPAIPTDLGPGDLPNEGGLEATAISYTKGCYLGQEVMARLKAMGQVRRRLLRIADEGFDAAIPALPTAVYQGEKRVGEVRSLVADGKGGVIGLAMLSLLSLDATAPLSLSPCEAGVFKVVDPS